MGRRDEYDEYDEYDEIPRRKPRLLRAFSDLTLSIASGLLIILLVIMLSTLVKWVINDVDTTFAGITKDISDAVVLEDKSGAQE